MDLWAVRIERLLTEREETKMLELLPPFRRERLVQVKQRERWREPLCAYMLLRMALWQQYRWKELPPIMLSRFGKPEFPDYPGVQFNLSHTHGAVLVGVDEQPLGVDIERIRPVSSLAMRRMADVTTERAFFQSWVRREARTKRTGYGIGTMMADETPLQPGERFAYLETFPGYVAGVATRNPGADLERIRIYTLGEDGKDRL